tara:strand:- start:97 stop:492 length:396 start_codon:yes stop_codon:yes gene_type:complete
MGFLDKYSKEELEYLYEKDPVTFYFLKPNSLDDIIQEFLAEYEVFIKPCYDYQPANKIEVEAWIKWKQWALDHKDFDNFRLENDTSYLDDGWIDEQKEIFYKNYNNLEYIRKFDAWIKMGRSIIEKKSKKL